MQHDHPFSSVGVQVDGLGLRLLLNGGADLEDGGEGRGLLAQAQALGDAPALLVVDFDR